MTFPEVQRADCYKVVATQGREGMQRQGKSSQETIMQAWEMVLVAPSRDTHNNTSELFCRMEPQPMEDVNWQMKRSSFQREV